MAILKRMSPEEISAAAHLVWSNSVNANLIALNAIQIIKRTHKSNFSFFSGKSSKRIVSGLFYLLGYRYNVVKKQRELAWCLGTTDVSVRASYRQWLEAFPDMFADVIGKFEQDTYLRYYVLLNLKRSMLQSESKRA